MAVVARALGPGAVAVRGQNGEGAKGLAPYREPAARLIGEATGDTFAWRRLATLTDTIGHRLSGSPQLERAIAWAVAEMKRDGLENVHTEKVMVPHWIRGSESAEIIEPARHAIVMLGLGGSVATPSDGAIRHRAVRSSTSSRRCRAREKARSSSSTGYTTTKRP